MTVNDVIGCTVRGEGLRAECQWGRRGAGAKNDGTASDDYLRGGWSETDRGAGYCYSWSTWYQGLTVNDIIGYAVGGEDSRAECQ